MLSSRILVLQGSKVIYKVDLSVNMAHSINIYLNRGMAPRVLSIGFASRSKSSYNHFTILELSTQLEEATTPEGF
jgi:hypothetical protein